MKLTKAHLDAITGNTRNVERKTALADLLNNGGALTAPIMAPHSLALFMSQIMPESGGMRTVVENLNYSAKGLRKTFRKYFTEAQADAYHRQPEKIANRVYANRMGNGNEASGDGWANRGMGYIQMTGYNNRVKFTTWMRAMFPDCPDFAKNPEALLDPKWLGFGAVWYFTTHVDNRFIESGNHEMIRRRVNGGLNGYKESLEYFDTAALVFLGFDPNSKADLARFQQGAGIGADGARGPTTRKALFQALFAMPKDDYEPEPAKDASPGWISRLLRRG